MIALNLRRIHPVLIVATGVAASTAAGLAYVLAPDPQADPEPVAAADRPEQVTKTVPPLIAEDTPYLTVEFPVKNSSPHAATLISVQKSCGCTDAELAKSRLDPGEETTLNVGIRMAHQLGPQHVTCVVDDDTGRKRLFTLETTVYRRARFTEPVVHFGVVKLGDRVERELTYVRAATTEAALADDVTFRTESGHLTLGAATASVERMPDGMWVKSYRFPVSLRTPSASEIGSGTVTAVRPAAQADGAVSAGVDWQVRSLYSLTPAQAFFTPADATAGGPATKTIRVTRPDGRPVRLTAVDSPHPQVVARVHAGSAGSASVDVTIDPTKLNDFSVGDVVLHTDDPDQPTVKLPVAAWTK